MTPEQCQAKACEMLLPTLADFLDHSKLDRPLAECTRCQILALVNAIVTAHQAALRELYKNEVPF